MKSLVDKNLTVKNPIVNDLLKLVVNTPEEVEVISIQTLGNFHAFIWSQPSMFEGTECFTD